MQYKAKITKKAVKYEEIVSGERLVLTKEEYKRFVEIFSKAMHWKNYTGDYYGVHVNQISFHGGYKAIGQHSVTLEVVVE